MSPPLESPLLPDVERALQEAGLSGLTVAEVYEHLPGEDHVRVKTAIERLYSQRVALRRRSGKNSHAWRYYHSACASTGGWQHW